MITLRMNKRYLAPADSDTGSDDSGADTGTRGGDAIGSGNDARVAMLNAINDANDVVHAEDLADILDDGTTAPFVPEGREDTPPEDDDPVQKPDKAAEPPAPQMITRKVNGKDLTLSLEDWLVRASKVEAADEYLQDAAAAKRAAIAAPAPEPVEVTPQPDPQAVRAEERANRLRIVRAIQMGTEDEAEAALAELQALSRGPTVTMDDIGRVTDDRLNFKNAISAFNNEFKDLVADPVLHKMVLDKDSALIAAGDKRAYADRYTEIGTEVRAWKDNLLKQFAPAVEVPPVTDLSTRRAAKAAAPKVPPTASTKATPAQVEDEVDDSPSAVIAAMAKARGGPGWARA